MRSGWFTALFAVILSVSAWLPWLTTTAVGGGHASAIGGGAGSLRLPAGFGAGQAIALLASVLLVFGAMIGRDLSVRLASVVAVVVSLAVVALIVCYYQMNVAAPVSAGYGLYIGAVSALGALCCSAWALGSVVVTSLRA